MFFDSTGYQRELILFEKQLAKRTLRLHLATLTTLVVHHTRSEAMAQGKLVTVTIPHDVGSDLNKILKIQKDLLGRLGHPACYSGFDILFRLESEYTVNSKTLELQPTAHVGP
jgi:hypothetical protein